MFNGLRLRLSLFGHSHGEAVGMVLDGLPAGEPFSADELQRFLDRRAPGRNALSSARRETDIPRFLSGVTAAEDGMLVTCGSPVCVTLSNADARSADYDLMRDIPRPGHADFPAWAKFGEARDVRGGGPFSARLTAPFCIAGGILLQLLKKRGVDVFAHAAAVAGICDVPFDPMHPVRPAGDFPVLDAEAGARMRKAVAEAKAGGDSVGGVVECAATGIPAGTGDLFFDGLENRIAQAVFAVPAVKGLEFGDGFAAALSRGSQNNDCYAVLGGKPAVTSNHAGGILGGLATGAPLIFRAAFKPTPSIALPQQSVSLSAMEPRMLSVPGRHDPCVVFRAVPCMEAAAALALADFLL